MASEVLAKLVLAIAFKRNLTKCKVSANSDFTKACQRPDGWVHEEGGQSCSPDPARTVLLLDPSALLLGMNQEEVDMQT